MSKKKDIEQNISAYLRNIYTNDELEDLAHFIPISNDNIEYYQKIQSLVSLFERITTSLNIFPILTEFFSELLREKSDGGRDITFGELSKNDFIEMLRECSLNEEEHPGRFF